MPREIDLPEDNERISLEEYVQHLEQNRYNLCDENDLIASAPYLKKLGNNKDFLTDHVFTELKNCLEFQESNIYAPEVLLLHATTNYFIRANIWKPITRAEEQIPGFRYDVCHDHNFDILTIGYIGPGYKSRAYTYDQTACVGMLGEVVNLVPKGIFTLTEGKVALYQAKLDVHIQLPPERLSVSINLIPKGNARHEVQLQFDESSGTICRYLNFSGAEVAVRLAGLIGNHECLEALVQIGNKHPNPKMRALALTSQLSIVPESADVIWDQIRVIQPMLVRHIVESEIAYYGACMRPMNDSVEEFP